MTDGSLLHTLSDPSPASNVYFGSDIAIDGNYAVISTNRYNQYDVFVFDVTTGLLDRTITHPTPTSGDYFGASVSISGNNIVIGANMRHVSGLSDVGEVYIFDATDGKFHGNLFKCDI